MSSDAAPTFAPLEPLPLSPIEELMCRVEDRFDGAGRVAVLFRLDGCIEADCLAAALLRLQHRHPKLRAVIAPGRHGHRRYEFDKTAPPIPFEITDCDDEEFPWREHTRRLLQSGFPPAGPLAAVTVLRSRSRGRSELILAAHHAIADGLSAIMLVDGLLAEYASLEQHFDVAPRPPLPPISVRRATSTGSWLARLRLLRGFVRLWREEGRFRWTALPEAHGIPHHSQWVHWVFSREETLALVRRCRRERVSLTGPLFAAVCCGLMDCLPVPDALFKCKFPIDMRETLGGTAGSVTAGDLGCFVSVVQEFYQVSQPPSFWELARRAHGDLQTFVRDGGPAFIYNMAAAVKKVRTPTSTKRGTLLATNYGVLNIRDAYGSLRPRACTLVFKNDVVGPSLVIEALVLGQRLNVGLAAFDLEPAFWARLQVAVRGHLDAAVGAGETASSER